MFNTNTPRRHLIVSATAAMATTLTACAAPKPRASSRPAVPTDFVLVHGAWHGAWCWRRVRDLLVAAGHRVWAPTLTGLCDRAHLLSPAVTLQTHVDDVVRLVQWEDLPSIVLVGHSYGGMVVTGAAEQLGERVRSLVYLDAFVPDAGQSVLGISGLDVASRIEAAVAAGDKLTLPAPPATRFGLAGADAGWVDRKMTPQPLRTFRDALGSTSGRDRIRQKVYVRTSKFPSAAFDGFAKRYAAQPGWRVQQWDEGHDMMLTVPGRTADVLREAAA